MRLLEVFLLPCILLAVFTTATALIEGLYCGKEDCYDVLQVDKDASSAVIRKAYRRLALEYHPDKNKEKGSRERFQLISTAYEILKDEEERANYDYMLDNPEQVYRHYYHYYRRRVAPQVDIRLVVAVTITVISIVQYLGWWYSYQTAIKAALRMPRYRLKAKEVAIERGLIKEGQKRKGVSKEEIKSEEEAILKSIMEENLNILGGYSKPVLWDVLWFKVLFSPYYIVCYLLWYTRWVWLFNIRKEAYGHEEKVYLTRKKMGLSVIQWETLEDSKREELVERQLWLESHWTEYKQEQEEERKETLLDNSKYKMYKRYMKNHGKKRMTFTD